MRQAYKPEDQHRQVGVLRHFVINTENETVEWCEARLLRDS
jgi:hypothetical protein